MKISNVLTVGESGFSAEVLRVDCVQTTQLPGIRLMGAPAQQSAEARERLAAAFHSVGIRFPSRKIVLALSGRGKWMPIHDLPVALAILAGMGVVPPSSIAELVAAGRLSLSGSLDGGSEIPHVSHTNPLAVPSDFLLFPQEGTPPGGVFPSLRKVLDWLKGGDSPGEFRARELAKPMEENISGFPPLVQRGALLAASGGHPLLLLGPHGYGKTTLGRSLANLLPPMERAGERPFRSPHFRISVAGLVGREETGAPGEWQKARYGVLFLDELLERPREKIEPLRSLLEAQDPGRPLFVAAANLCPCGRWGATHGGCRCTPSQRGGYLGRLSGAMEDRFDLKLHLGESANPRRFRERGEGFRHLVAQSRKRARERQGKCNALLVGDEPFRIGGWERGARKLAESTPGSLRAVASVARVALTLADMEPSPTVKERHVLEALFFRG
ncbi:MAG: ATP-binding protein [Bdellovibrionales bacterium]|nr:ATP-binding protein [Bdellovibrionales bacterium]